MLAAYFDIRARPEAPCPPPAPPPAKKKAKKAKKPADPPRPVETTASLHARFDPLPPEPHVPRPAEVAGQAWHALAEGVEREDDVAVFEEEWDGLDGTEDGEPGDDAKTEASEPDFEPESLDLCSDVDVASSFEDGASLQFMSRRRSERPPKMKQALAMYSGPQLCCEDDEFD